MAEIGTKGQMMTEVVCVNAGPLARLLQQADPSGFLSNELGVAWADDGSGYARRLVSATDGRRWTVWPCPRCGEIVGSEPDDSGCDHIADEGDTRAAEPVEVVEIHR